MDLDSLATRVGLRAGAGLATGGIVLAGLTVLGPTPSFSAPGAAAIAAVIAAILPRLGWVAAMCLVIGWLASPDANREGTALIVTVAAVPIPLLIRGSGLWWPTPAAAPLLGAAGMAPLFVAFAGLANTAWRRAGIAASGMLAVVCAEVLSGKELLFGVPDGVQPHGEWESSLSSAATDALWPLITSPALLPIAAWAGFAALMPFLVRGTSLALDALGAALWAAGLTASLLALGTLMDDPNPRGIIAGGILALVAAVAAAGAGLVSRVEDEESLDPRMAPES
jgi:hypothetical protein